MKRIKSRLLETEIIKLNKAKKNKSIYKKSLSTNPSMRFNKTISLKNNISFYKKNSQFQVNSNKNLELINYYLNENKDKSKKDNLYRTEIRTSQRIIRFPSSHKRKNNYITSYASSRRNNPSIFKRKGNVINFLESQTFVNLQILLEKRKSLGKIKIPKYHLDSMKLRKDYAEFITRNSLLTFKTTHNTAFAHNLNTNFLIYGFNKIKLDEEKQKKRINKYFSGLAKFKKIEIELKDVVDPDYLDYLEIKKNLRNILLFDNGINFKKESFYNIFNNFENRINYIYDIEHVPHFKNRLLKYNTEISYENQHINELDCPNFIDYKVWNFLNIKKAKIQEMKDKGLDKIVIAKQRIIGSNHKKKYKIKTNDICKVNEIEKDNKNINKSEIDEDLEDYFINKKIYKINSLIASNKLKNVVYNKFF